MHDKKVILDMAASVTGIQGEAERVRLCGWDDDAASNGHFHRRFILTANTFRRSLTFLSWDGPAGGGICTQGDSFAELDHMVRDAVEGYFADGNKPERIRLHFIRDPELAVA